MGFFSFSVQFNSVAQSCLTLCNPMDCSTPGLPVHHQFPMLAQTHVYRVGAAIQSSHPLTSPSPTAFCREQAYCILSAALSTASSFRIWNSSTGILSLPGASVRSSTHDKGHEEGGLAYAKAGSSLRSSPGNS